MNVAMLWLWWPWPWQWPKARRVLSGLLIHCLVSSYLVLPCHASSCPVLSCPFLFGFVMRCLVLYCLVLSYLILSYPLSCRALSCHVASCHVMSCHVMSCHVCYVMEGASAERMPTHALERFITLTPLGPSGVSFARPRPSVIEPDCAPGTQRDQYMPYQLRGGESEAPTCRPHHLVSRTAQNLEGYNVDCSSSTQGRVRTYFP